MLAQKEYDAVLGVLSDPFFEPTSEDNIYRISLPDPSENKTVQALKNTIIKQLKRNGQVRLENDKAYIHSPKHSQSTIRSNITDQLNDFLCDNMAGPDIAGLYKPGSWPEKCGTALYVDASYIPQTGKTGVGIQAYAITKKRHKTGCLSLALNAPDHSGSYEAEQTGLLYALEVARDSGVQYPVIVGDNIAANRKFAQTQGGGIALDTVTPFTGLDRDDFCNDFQSVRVLSVNGQFNRKADALADKGRSVKQTIYDAVKSTKQTATGEENVVT